MKQAYGVLLDSMKVSFRTAWAAQRSFEFARETRVTSNSFRRRRDEVGSFKTQLQIQMILGGSDKPEAVAQAQNYVNMCKQPELKAGLGDTAGCLLAP